MSNRFDSDSYLRQWQETGTFPAIHADLWQLLNEESRGTSYLDLCCSTGLLGTHVLTSLKQPVIGVEGDADAIGRARAAGIPLGIVQMQVKPGTLPDLCCLLREHNVDTVIARRCFPELLIRRDAVDREFAVDLSAALASCGVQQIFHQGRQVSRGATGLVADVWAEAAFMSQGGQYRSTLVRGECGLLELVR